MRLFMSGLAFAKDPYCPALKKRLRAWGENDGLQIGVLK